MIKKYYIGFASSIQGESRNLDFVCGPYELLSEAKMFLEQIKKEFGLNFISYEFKGNINIYRSTKVDYQYIFETKKVGRKIQNIKGKHGGLRYIPIKRKDILYLTEEEFIKKLDKFL